MTVLNRGRDKLSLRIIFSQTANLKLFNVAQISKTYERLLWNVWLVVLWHAAPAEPAKYPFRFIRISSFGLSYWINNGTEYQHCKWRKVKSIKLKNTFCDSSSGKYFSLQRDISYVSVWTATQYCPFRWRNKLTIKLDGLKLRQAI